jgi:hypothetical protein
MNKLSVQMLRVASLVFVLLGALLYALLFYNSRVEWEQNLSIHESWLTEIWFVIADVIFASGLPPMLLTIYFWVLGKAPRDWLAGFAFVPLFIFVHYVVAVFMAHSSPFIYVPMMAVELLSAIAVIWYWHKKRG